MRKQAVLPKNSAFVSASAGTGKTKILIDRLVNLLLNGVKPNKILCLTYTKAAAAEILARINQKLSKFTICSDEELKQELEEIGISESSQEIEYKARILFVELLDSIEPINIQTIHSFCQQLLLKFPFESGIDLNFSLLDENKISLLIMQAKDILLSSIDKYSDVEKSLSYLAWHIKEYSLNELLEEIILNREKLDHFFKDHNNNLEAALSSVDPGIPNEEEIIIEFIKNIPIDNPIIEALSLSGKNDLSKSNKLAKFLKYSDELKQILLSEYLNCFLTSTDEPTKMLYGKYIKDKFPEVSKVMDTEQERVYKFSIFFKTIKAINLSKAFIILSFYIRDIYQNLKSQSNSLDYDDLISKAMELLNNSQHADWIRYKLDGGIEHILIDEAQDASNSQWGIINRLSEDFLDEGNKSIFIVGDAKQSIFGFQGAVPEIFNKMNVSLRAEMLRVQLQKSYRSGAKILDFVDKIFNQAHIKMKVSEVEEVIKHDLHRDSLSSVEIWPLVIKEESKEKQEWLLPSHYERHPEAQLKGPVCNEETAEQELAKMIAERIKLELDSRSMTSPGDIMILTRRRTEFIGYLIKELRSLNVATAGIDRFTLVEHPIVLDLIALSSFVLCSADDLNLAITLKSPLFNIDETELLELAHNREGYLWDELKLRDHSSIRKINEFMDMSYSMTPFEFYFNLIEYFNVRSSYLEEYGSEANDILDTFLDLVSDFEKENIPSLQIFLDFVNNVKTEVKRDFSQKNDQVRIMTVHGAKGLQAPLVFLTDTVSLPFNNDTIIWLSEDKLLWPGRSKYYPEIAKKAKLEREEKEYAEYLRLLYVALTRAEDKLIICGAAKEEEISPKCWYSICKSGSL